MAAEPVVSNTAFSADDQAVRERMAGVVAIFAMANAPVLPEEPYDATFGLRVARAARLGLTHAPWGFRDDCSGFVSSVFTAVGAPMDGHVASLWDLAIDNDALHWESVPRVGDLVFFDDTHDRNNNGRWDDDLTHIGVVIDVTPDGTAYFAHGGTSRGRVIGAINVDRFDEHEDEAGNLLNSYVRQPAWNDAPGSMYLAGELWAGFATVDPTVDWLGAGE